MHLCPGAADRKRNGDPERKALKRQPKFERMEAAPEGERAATGKKREAAAEPTFHNAVRRNQSFGSRNRKRKEVEAAGGGGDPNGPRSEDAPRDPREMEAGFALRKSPERELVEVRFDGITRTGTPSKFHFGGKPDRGPREARFEGQPDRNRPGPKRPRPEPGRGRTEAAMPWRDRTSPAETPRPNPGHWRSKLGTVRAGGDASPHYFRAFIASLARPTGETGSSEGGQPEA